MRICTFLLLFFLACPAVAAPELLPDDRDRLIDGTTDRDDNLDGQDGFYVLLRNASTWKGDDFSGDAGAAVAPPPDYGFLKDKPEQARGNVYMVQGWFIGADRWPTLTNHDSERMQRTDWGDQVTRWLIVTEKGNSNATVMVIFHDPNGKMTAPEEGSEVRIAARFHKLWQIPSASGPAYTYPVFVGGAAETVAKPAAPSSSGDATSALTKVLAGVVIVGGFFIVMRHLMKRVAASGGGGRMLQDRLDELRREREAHERQEAEDGGDEEEEELPEDPIAALDVLRQKHEAE